MHMYSCNISPQSLNGIGGSYSMHGVKSEKGIQVLNGKVSMKESAWKTHM